MLVAQPGSIDSTAFIPADIDAFLRTLALIASILLTIGTILAGFLRMLRNIIEREFEPIKEENSRLREELDRRFRYPRFAKDIVDLAEKTADLKVDELKAQHERATAQRDQETASAIAAQVEEIEKLRNELGRRSCEQEELAHRLQHAVVATPPGKMPQMPSGCLLGLFSLSGTRAGTEQSKP